LRAASEIGTTNDNDEEIEVDSFDQFKVLIAVNLNFIFFLFYLSIIQFKLLFNKNKSDVFSFGLTILNAALLEDISGLNSNIEKLNRFLTKLDKLEHYSDFFKKLVRSMLSWDEASRPPFSVIYETVTENA